MITFGLADYLGRAVDELLKTPPFSEWRVVRSIERDPPILEFWYEFEGHGVDIICDGRDRIKTLFVHRGDGEALIDVPFSFSRKEVLERLGTPVRSLGVVVGIPGVGPLGRSDHFRLPQGTLAVRFFIERDEIQTITFMRPDAVPPPAVEMS